MGKLKKEVFNLLNSFIAENNDKDGRVFSDDLLKLINSLTIILNQNSDIPVNKDMVVIHTDGSSAGNPGKARAGILIADHLNNIILKESRDIGIMTNNQAEYTAIIEALKISLEKKFKKVILYSDSELTINQVNNLYKIKNVKLKELYSEIKNLEKYFEYIKFIHISRKKNKIADVLSR